MNARLHGNMIRKFIKQNLFLSSIAFASFSFLIAIAISFALRLRSRSNNSKALRFALSRKAHSCSCFFLRDSAIYL